MKFFIRRSRPAKPLQRSLHQKTNRIPVVKPERLIYHEDRILNVEEEPPSLTRPYITSCPGVAFVFVGWVEPNARRECTRRQSGKGSQKKNVIAHHGMR